MTNILVWIGLVAAGWIVIGVVVFVIREREARDALVQFLAAVVLGPALITVGVFLKHRAPRAMPLSAEALERFARQQTSHIGLSKRERSAWLLSYRGHGLILVRRRSGSDSINNVGIRANRCRR